MKKIFTLAALAALAFSANAFDLPLTTTEESEDPNAPLNTGWGSTYDQATQTITYEGDWSGRGWWLAGDTPFDGSQYTDFTIKFTTNVPGQVIVQYSQLVYDADGNVVIEYDNEKHESSSKSFAIGDEGVNIVLNPKYKAEIDQIYIQCGQITDIESPTIVLASAELVDNSDAPINYVVFSGEKETDWWPGIEISTDFFPYLVAGSQIAITFSEVQVVEEACFKLQTINADWSQTWLPSLALIPGAEVYEATEADPSDVHVPVTEPGTVMCPINAEDVAIIGAAGVQQIMLVGQKLVVSKVEIIPADSGVKDLEIGQANGAAAYYNMQGVRVANPRQGQIYIVVRDGKASKQVIR